MKLRTEWRYGDKIWEAEPWDNMQHGPKCEQASDTSDDDEPSSSGGTNPYNEAFGRITVNQLWEKVTRNAFQKDVKGENMKI